MHIHVPVPREGNFSIPISWEEVEQTVSAMAPGIIDLAEKAYVYDNEAAWESVQQLLYHWNLDELERKTSVTDFSRAVRQSLRNRILNVEDRTRKQTIQLQCWDDFTPERAIKELESAAFSHRIHSHPLLAEMSKNGLSKDSVRLFIENYYVNNRVFHLHIAAQSLSAPMDLRGEMYKNLYDEMGSGDPDAAHPLLFLRNFRSLGKPETVTPITGSIYLLNTKIYHTFLSGNALQGVGGLGFLELAMPAQMEKILEGMKKSGLPDDDLIFWELHISLDQEHGDAWFDDLRQVVHTREDAQAVLEGGVSLLEARAVFYDDVWNNISENAEFNMRLA